eukprot:tig00000310_g24001.t1
MKRTSPTGALAAMHSGDAFPFELLQRQSLRIQDTASANLQLFKNLEYQVEVDDDGRQVCCHDNVYKSRKYRLRAKDKGMSSWVGRRIRIELVRCDTGEKVPRGCCGEAGYAPLRDDKGAGYDALVSEIDRFGESVPFQMSACRHCHRSCWLQIRIVDADTGRDSGARIRATVRSRPPPEPDAGAGESESGAGAGAGPGPGPGDEPGASKRARTDGSPPTTEGMEEEDEGAARPPPGPGPGPGGAAPNTAAYASTASNDVNSPGCSYSNNVPSPTFFESAALAFRALFGPPSPESPPPSSSSSALPSLVSSYGSDASASGGAEQQQQRRGPPAPDIVAQLERRIVGLVVEGEARSWRRRASNGDLGAPQQPPPEPADEAAALALAPLTAPALLPKADPLEQLFARFAAISVEPRPRSLSWGPGGAAGPATPPLSYPQAALAPDGPRPPPAAVSFSFAAVRPPYRLSPDEEAELLRQVADAEAAEAGAALGVLLGDPRVLGTALFRTRAGWLRTRRLLELVRLHEAARGAARGRPLFAGPSVEGVVTSLATALLSAPASYDGAVEDAARACENVWNAVLCFTSDYTLASADLGLITLEEALALHQKARETADAAVASARAGVGAARPGTGPGPLAASMMLWVEARMRLAITLRQHGHFRAALECQFEAWDALLRLEAFPHRLEAECLRELVELHARGNTARPPARPPASDSTAWLVPSTAFLFGRAGSSSSSSTSLEPSLKPPPAPPASPRPSPPPPLSLSFLPAVLLERADMAAHFAEKLYWFEETTDDLHFRATCMQTLGFLSWHEGGVEEALEYYRRACSVAHELVARSGGDPFYTLHASRIHKSLFVFECTRASFVQAFRQLEAALELDLVCELSSGEFDELSWLGALVWRPDGFRLSHVIRIFRVIYSIVEWLTRDSHTPRLAHILFNIGNIYMLDGKYEEALETYRRAESMYRATLAIAAVFPESHRRIRALRRAAAAAAARLHPSASFLAAEVAAVAHAPPEPRWRIPATAGTSVAASLEEPPVPSGCDLPLYAALKPSYGADSWHQIAYWSARRSGRDARLLAN